MLLTTKPVDATKFKDAFVKCQEINSYVDKEPDLTNIPVFEKDPALLEEKTQDKSGSTAEQKKTEKAEEKKKEETKTEEEGEKKSEVKEVAVSSTPAAENVEAKPETTETPAA